MKHTISGLMAASLALGSTALAWADDAITEMRFDVGDITSLEAWGSGTLTVIEGRENVLTLRAPNDVLNDLQVEERGRHLKVGPKRWFGFEVNTTKVDYILEVESLSAIEVSGAFTVSSIRLSSDELNIKASGATQLDLSVDTRTLHIKGSGSMQGFVSGSTHNLNIDMSGASELNARDLVSRDAVIDVSGAADITLTANDSLTVEASGAATVNYYGRPAVNVKTSGASRVRGL